MESLEERGPYIIGVDVGTASVRAALVCGNGNIIKTAVKSIHIWNDAPSYYEQSSTNIWQACCSVMKEVSSGVDKHLVKGIGFDATCSLVVLNDEFQPVSVSLSGEEEKNVVMWMDHRAAEEASFINSKNHEVLKYTGGSISLEMQPPKLMWLKKKLPESCWSRAKHLMDLPDFLTWKATGSLARSLCSLVCKWTYQAGPEGSSSSGWSDSFWSQIGLEDLISNKYSKIGNIIQSPGEAISGGLSSEAAEETGLVEGTAVGTSLIDAHAGAVGMLGASIDKGHDLQCSNQPITSRLALISGTSSCHMAISEPPVFVPGVWGPYYSSMVPGFWGNEGGQSITGKLVDHVIETHPAFRDLQDKAAKSGRNVYSELNSILSEIAAKESVSHIALLSKELHIWPDFHGNRSPLADPTLKGMICGLSLATDVENLALLYLATIQALAHGTRFIIERMEEHRDQFLAIFSCGGLSKNSLFVQIHADVTGLPIVLPKETESVLLGSAILGACAAGLYPSVQTAMESMSGVGSIIKPDSKTRSFYNKKHKVFLKMLQDQLDYNKIMKS